jgi:beta-glucosidase
MAKMTLEEKVGQTIQGDIASITPGRPESIRWARSWPAATRRRAAMTAPRPRPGSTWSTPSREALAARPGGTPIPIMFGIDAVHGHNNIVGATIFPHNIGLGAARDPELIRRIGAATAQEVAATARLDLRPDPGRAARRPLGPQPMRAMPRIPRS